MAVSNPSDERDLPIAGINVTPLVDVMLVLLVIFMITAPVLATRWVQDHAPAPLPAPAQPEPVRLAIGADGGLHWNGRRIDPGALAPSLRIEALREPQPALHLEPAPDASYQALATVLADARHAGMRRLAVVDAH